MSHISAAMAGSVLALAIVSEGHAYIHAINMNAHDRGALNRSNPSEQDAKASR